MSEAREPEILHKFRNHLAIVVSFADLLLVDLPKEDTHRPDVVEIHKSARAALALLDDLSKLIR